MNSYEFMEALSDIDDDLILNAQVIPKKNRCARTFGLRIAATIALVILLPLTVAAVTIGVRILNSSDEAPYYENYFLGVLPLNSKITTIEYELSPQVIEIPLMWTEALTDAWKSFGYEHSYFTGIDLRDPDGTRTNYGTISQMEDLLNAQFVYSEEIRSVAQGVYVTLAVTDQERAANQFRTQGVVNPDGIVLYVPFQRESDTNLDPEVVDYCGLSIYIPLTQSFAEQYASHFVLSSVSRQDLTQHRFHSTGSIEVVMLENMPDDREPLSAFAAWELDGIAYLVEMKTNYGVMAVPGDILTPYLENLEG